MTVRLSDLSACFQGVIPAAVATCSADGEPNATWLSQVYYVDERHVALSCQFFNKTRRNVSENPYAAVRVLDPRTFESYRLKLRFHHLETEGPLFDTMAARIQVIASHTGMSGIFRLISADVYEVLSVKMDEGYLLPPDPSASPATSLTELPGPLSELRGLQLVSERIARARDLEALLSNTLAALDEIFGFAHSMILIPGDDGRRLITLSSRGYGEEGVGAEAEIGKGVIGTAAERRRMVKLTDVRGELRYGRAIRDRLRATGDSHLLSAEIPLPGLCDAQAQLALPLLSGDRLVGVLAVESQDPMRFDDWDEAFLQIVANQIAVGIDRMQALEDEPEEPSEPITECCPPANCRRQVAYYASDDSVFVDGEYLIRNVPGKILWKILRQHQTSGQREFSNRELRLDPSLGLPGYRDNLESRLILLRRRLEAKCPELRMVPVKRGRFALELDCELELVEKELV